MKKGKEYLKAIGRRKTSVARIRLWVGSGEGFLVNNKDIKEYFSVLGLADVATAPMRELKLLSKFKVTAIVKGGGKHSQAQAISHGLSRVLVEFNPDFQKKMRNLGFLTRDPRMKERKKPGLKGARKAPQWQKR